MNDDAIGCLLVIVVIVAVILAAWAFDLNNYFSDEITAYSLDCSVPFNNEGKCDGNLKTSRKVNFRILDVRQEVIWWYPEMGKETGLGKYKDCVIMDRKNWQCEDIGMVDGLLITSGNWGLWGLKPVSKFAWWKQKVEQWLK